LHFNLGLPVINRPFETLQRLFACLFADLTHRVVKNALSQALLPLPHHATDELGHQRTAIDRIREYIASFGYSSSWHIRLSLLGTGFGTFRSVLRASLLAVGDAD